MVDVDVMIVSQCRQELSFTVLRELWMKNADGS